MPFDLLPQNDPLSNPLGFGSSAIADPFLSYQRRYAVLIKLPNGQTEKRVFESFKQANAFFIKVSRMNVPVSKPFEV